MTIAIIFESEQRADLACYESKCKTSELATDNFSHIIPPIDKELLKSELTKERFLRVTNKGNNELYVINHHNAPNCMKEVGRLREITFAASGGGTGLPYDIDEFDTNEHCYDQLIVWSPEDEEMVGGYRFIDCSKIVNLSPIPLSTLHYFDFSERFVEEYLPETIELGRSWVQPNYQPSVDSRKGLFSLDNLWDGLGAITVEYPNSKHFFGKVTMYPQFEREARDAILSFMHHYFQDHANLVNAIEPLPIENDMQSFLNALGGLDFKDGFRVLNDFVKERGEMVPPLFNNYMQLSSTMKMFGTAMNNDFGAVEESAILVTIADIFEDKRERYVLPYLEQKENRE